MAGSNGFSAKMLIDIEALVPICFPSDHEALVEPIGNTPMHPLLVKWQWEARLNISLVEFGLGGNRPSYWTVSGLCLLPNILHLDFLQMQCAIQWSGLLWSPVWCSSSGYLASWSWFPCYNLCGKSTMLVHIGQEGWHFFWKLHKLPVIWRRTYSRIRHSRSHVQEVIRLHRTLQNLPSTLFPRISSE